MKFIFIFILLLSICSHDIYCGVDRNTSTSQVATADLETQLTDAEKSTLEEIQIVKPVATTTSEIQLANAEESTPEEIPIEPEKPPSIALKLIKKKKGGFRWPLEPQAIHLHRGESMVNVCPAETPEQRKKAPNYKFCLFIQEESTTHLNDRICEKEPEPKLWNVKDGQNKCGKEGKGVLYMYNHQICWKSKSVMAKVVKHTFPNSKTLDEIFPQTEQDFIDIYTACWLHDKETIYVKFLLLPANPEELDQAFEDHKLENRTEGYVNLEFRNQAELFKEKIQKDHLREMFGDDFNDYLIPRMLASPKLVTPLVARNSLYSYLNVAPQWFSMKDNWQMLEQHIQKLRLNSPYEIFMFVGVQGKITKDGKPLSIKIDKDTSFDMPSVWWNLLINEDYDEGIVIAMQNEPKNFSNLDNKLCIKSICSSSGWKEIEKIAYCCEFDERMRELLNLQKENFTINKVFDPTKSIKSRPRPKHKHRKSESRLRQWIKKAFEPKPDDLISR